MVCVWDGQLTVYWKHFVVEKFHFFKKIFIILAQAHDPRNIHHASMQCKSLTHE